MRQSTCAEHERRTISEREVRAGKYGIKGIEPCCIHIERSSGRDQTIRTSCRAHRFEAKRTSTTLSVNPTELPMKRLEMQQFHPHPRRVVESCTANSNANDHRGPAQRRAALHPPCIAKTDREVKNKRNPPKEHSLSTVPSVPLDPLIECRFASGYKPACN